MIILWAEEKGEGEDGKKSVKHERCQVLEYLRQNADGTNQITELTYNEHKVAHVGVKRHLLVKVALESWLSYIVTFMMCW